MANTYTQIYIQTVFAVEHRQCLIRREHQEELHKYITGIVQNLGHKLIAIHAMPDHIHILIGQKPAMSLSELVQKVKADSSGFINRKRWLLGRFNWQEGYGAFSYGHSQLGAIIRYVENQEQHHARVSFRKEYLAFLKKFDVAYDAKYVFDFDALGAIEQ
jgi:putative transposase